jgi:cytochrome c oxidase cbb3-type subunit I/II
MSSSSAPLRAGRANFQSETSRTPWPLIRAHTYAAFAGLFLSALFGLMVSVKFNAPSFLGGHGWDTWGRLRYDHTQGILYAWLGNAFIAFLYYAVPLLTGRSITSERLGWYLFGIFNFVAVLGGWTLVLAGHSQPLEWAEFPLGIAAVVEFAFLLLIVQFGIPFFKTKGSELYVAGWYLLGAITFTALAYPVGNLLPHILPGAMGAAFSGLWIHDAVGLFVTPLGVAIAYFVIPAVMRKPIYSHFYSMIGFWLLFLVYPLNGMHHYVYSSLPMSAQHASEIASIYQGIDVIIVVANLLLSIGIVSDNSLIRDIPLRFVWTSVVLYLVVSIQGSVQAVMAFNSYIHFTDWVIGHSHLAMIGFASFAAMGGLAHIDQARPGSRLSRRALAWSYWLLVVGLGLMVVDLTGAGLVQASMWRQHVPWIDSVRASMPYWAFRSIDGGLLIVGFVVFAVSFFVGGPERMEAATATPQPEPQSAATRETDRWISTAYGITFGAGLVFFVISFLALGVIPAISVHEKIARNTPAGVHMGLTAQEKQGQTIYARNGCAYCHTEQVRFTTADEWRFGPPTQAWETQAEFPQMWGTRRIGPDLARESGRRPRDWQLVHLYDPRYTVPDSVMPGYPWLFEGGVGHPSNDARALVAYLDTLGRPALDAARAHAAPEPENASFIPAMSLEPKDSDQGRAVFVANCSGCHGADGQAHTPGGQALRPVAMNLVDFQLTPADVVKTLENGVPGTAMPPWNDLPGDQFRAVAEYVLSLSRTPEPRAEDMWALKPVEMGAGERIFAAHCVRCHGEQGAGNGPDAAQYQPQPADFRHLLVSFRGTEAVMHNGVPGSGMQAYPLLSPQEIQALTYYIRSFYRGPAEAASAQSSPAMASQEEMP